jgi:hypothetical protein
VQNADVLEIRVGIANREGNLSYEEDGDVSRKLRAKSVITS